MEEAARADAIIIMDKGKIITSGTPFALKERYAMDKLKIYFAPEKESMVLNKLKAFQKLRTLSV